MRALKNRAAISLLFLLFSFSNVSPVSATDSRLIDIVSVSWPGARMTTSTSEIEIAVREIVGPRWKNYTSFSPGDDSSSIAFKIGSTLASPIELIRPMQCEGSAAAPFMELIRQEAYKRLRIDDWRGRYLVILTPSAGCIWTGRALIGNIKNPSGVVTMHDSSSPFVLAHELGHTLGLGHSNFLRCDSGKNDGPWGDDCKAVEYGGAIDVMGNIDIDLPLSTYNQWRLGFLDKGEVYQSWLSERIELNSVTAKGGVKAIFIRDGRATYWIEYRDSLSSGPYKPGLVIYRTDPPPMSALVSPNPEDALGPEFDQDVTADVWMLNWDTYTYVRSKSSGSMTLPSGRTATVFSGALRITANASASPDRVEVVIERRPDLTPPPRPVLTDPKSWRSPLTPILSEGYEDLDSAIARFEARISSRIISLSGSIDDTFTPTYLNPISPSKTLYLKDLPEGEYELSVRSIDAWGNVSNWSNQVKAVVDRGLPTFTVAPTFTSIVGSDSILTWKGLKDEGVGLCSTEIYNKEGFVNFRSSERFEPSLTFPTNSSYKGRALISDCLGNAISGELSVRNEVIPGLRAKTTGRWISTSASHGKGAIRCNGKCSASISASGSIQVIVGEGSANVTIGGSTRYSFTSTNSSSQRVSQRIEIGSRSRVLRVSGSNFVLIGIVKSEIELGKFEPVLLPFKPADPTLDDPVQRELSAIGFTQSDFVGDWIVIPMARGTTLLDPTLDLCEADFRSESGREFRRQVSVTKDRSAYQFLSTEVVKYRTHEAAAAALRELKEVFANCLKNGGGQRNGITTKYTFAPLPSLTVLSISEEDRVVVRATIGDGVEARQLLAFYQFNGRYFSGLYVVKPGSQPLDGDEVDRWIGVAKELGSRLPRG